MGADPWKFSAGDLQTLGWLLKPILFCFYGLGEASSALRCRHCLQGYLRIWVNIPARTTITKSQTHKQHQTLLTHYWETPRPPGGSHKCTLCLTGLPLDMLGACDCMQSLLMNTGRTLAPKLPSFKACSPRSDLLLATPWCPGLAVAPMGAIPTCHPQDGFIGSLLWANLS